MRTGVWKPLGAIPLAPPVTTATCPSLSSIALPLPRVVVRPGDCSERDQAAEPTSSRVAATS